jgi:hypothetical protein
MRKNGIQKSWKIDVQTGRVISCTDASGTIASTIVTTYLVNHIIRNGGAKRAERCTPAKVLFRFDRLGFTA